eukprot:TRINITY_DN12371_c0_g1_i1.p1 TRINITY_DN12371_c0_g1~~TRINITY_DN12371_c0_g1_i1.p1  ORF type:complete len:261 (-),score=45.35 TRINITY_DN12371_c0_g1_i1:116-898(-)
MMRRQDIESLLDAVAARLDRKLARLEEIGRGTTEDIALLKKDVENMTKVFQDQPIPVETIPAEEGVEAFVTNWLEEHKRQVTEPPWDCFTKTLVQTVEVEPVVVSSPVGPPKVKAPRRKVQPAPLKEVRATTPRPTTTKMQQSGIHSSGKTARSRPKLRKSEAESRTDTKLPSETSRNFASVAEPSPIPKQRRSLSLIHSHLLAKVQSVIISEQPTRVKHYDIWISPTDRGNVQVSPSLSAHGGGLFGHALGRLSSPKAP